MFANNNFEQIRLCENKYSKIMYVYANKIHTDNFQNNYALQKSSAK